MLEVAGLRVSNGLTTRKSPDSGLFYDSPLDFTVLDAVLQHPASVVPQLLRIVAFRFKLRRNKEITITR